MKLILRADIDNLGRLGDIVKVKPGYGRNYLLPQGLAMLATEANAKVFELERKKLQEKMDKIRFEAEEMGKKLEEAKLVLRVRVGDGDRLYGSVTNSHIGEALAEMGLEVDKKKIILGDPIRSLGVYSVPVKLHPDVQCELTVSVVRHDWVEGQPITSEEAEAALELKLEAEAEATAKAAEEEAVSNDAGQADESEQA
ncbi:large subunit ribosomal protein L9 [Desulfobaculum xiamenense]|uniref:Large ribosomal subunit protein bL9 n=1 Tax=Desulfobaculum xiamenense TaxID=995050 RepID=A0A846QQT9_9BACT|nr:50S ribosomal protein L9 [Desulfobaculum xiamenense]NJB67019.1 large subunit ribosomal protein L9 [Desulfobaculum xiamenense]